MRASERIGADPQKVSSFNESPYSFVEFPDKMRIEKCRELISAGLLDEALVEAKELAVGGSDEGIRSKGKAYIALILTGQNKYRSAINYVEEEFDRDPGSAKDKEAQLTAMSILYPKGFEAAVRQFAQKYNVDPYLMFALIREESRFNPQAISRSKARGLTQIMPRTGRLIAKGLKIRPYQTSSLYDPDLNVKMGTYYLSCMLGLFNGNKYLALASYNGGSGHVSRWLKRLNYSDIDDFVENIPLRETRLYVQKVLESYWHYKSIYGGS
jgi:soluble lytic murein transglycosylase